MRGANKRYLPRVPPKRKNNMENMKELTLVELADRDAIRGLIDEYGF